MDTIQFNQEACNACKSFAETTSAIFDKWRSSYATSDGSSVDSIQENNPPEPTIGKVLAQPGID